MKMKKDLACRYLSILLMIVTLISNLGISAYASDNLQLSLIPNPNIDVVLTLGQTSVNANNFEADIKEALRKKGIDTSKVNVQAVKTEEQNLQSSFAWNQDVSSSIGSISLQNNGSRIQMYGNQRNPGFNKIYTANNTDPEISEQEMGFSFNLNFGDSFDGAGVLLNTHVTGGSMNGYALIFPYSGNAKLFRITNWYSRDEIYPSGYYGSPNSKATLIGEASLGTSGNFVLKTTKDKLTIIKNGTTYGNFNLPVHYGWGLGFFSDHYSHNCSSIGEFSLNNLQLTTTKAKEFKDVIRQPNWRADSKRFIVNLENNIVPNFNSPSALGEILTRLINEEIHYIGWGTSTNRTQALDFVKKNNNNGMFAYNTSYTTSVSEIAQYIFNQLDLSGGESQYVLVGEPIGIKVTPAHLATNTQNSAYPQGRWKIDHDYDYFHNSMGQAPWANQWQKDLKMVFDKPGKYDVWFENNHPTPRYIYAHRRPIADFSSVVTKNGSTYYSSFSDLSYDPDAEYNADKGLSVREWKYKRTIDTNWTTGKPSTLVAGNEYLVQLRVKDHQGVWSVPQSRYISTDQNTTVPPVANFNVSPNPLSMYQTLTVNDTSYDPAGRSITSRNWIVTRSNGSQIWNSSSPLTNFISYGAGEYTISLKVRNDANLWSETFSRKLTVTSDNEAPEAIISPTSHDWTTGNIGVRVNYTEPGGSGFKYQRYALSTSPSKPSSGWSSFDSSTVRNLTVSSEGSWYLHIEAHDNAGNVLNQSMGTYKVDRTAPTATHSLSPSAWTSGNVNIIVNASDSGSGVNRIKLPNGTYLYGSTASYSVGSNGSYTFTLEDKVDNSRTYTVTVNNIDKINPTLTVSANPTAWTGGNVTLTAVASDGQSGMKKIQRPDGVWVSGSTTTHQVTVNGTYTFIAEDNVGNQISQSITVTNIDKTNPNAPTITTNEEWSKNNVSVGISSNGDVGAGVDSIEYMLSGATTRSWTTFNGTFDISNEGITTVTARVKDKVGNYSSSSTKTIRVDKSSSTNPSITHNLDWTNIPSVPVTIKDGIDLLSGVNRTEYSLSGATTLGWTTYSGVINVTNEGVTKVTARTIDNLGHISDITTSNVRIDRTLPHATSVIINENAVFSNSRSVTLTLNAMDSASGVDKMQFKNEDGSWSTEEAYKTSKAWTLSTVDGTKAVWVRYKDLAGNWSNPVKDTIELDMTSPVITKFTIQDDREYYNNHSVHLNLKADDNLSGIKEVYISNDNTNWTTRPYAEKINWSLTSGDGTKTVYLKIIDTAGNMTSTVSDKIFIDTVKPTGSIIINNGDEQTMSRDVKLKIDFSDNVGGSGIDIVKIVENSREYIFPTIPSSPKTIDWRLEEGVGLKTVHLVLVDKAGNVSNSISDSIIVDKLSIERFTLTEVVNPTKYPQNIGFTPKVWTFEPQNMLSGANISFAVELKTPYDASVVQDSVRYKVEIAGSGYHKALTGDMLHQVADNYSKTITLPEDAPKGSKVFIIATATRKLLVSPFDIQVEYFPGVESTTKAQIGIIEGNIYEAIRFNETN